MWKLLGLLFVTLVAAQPDVAVENFKIGVLEKGEDASSSSLKTVAQFSKLSSLLEVSGTQRLFTTFNIVAKSSGEKVKPHQVFLYCENSATHAEIVYVADAQKDGSFVAEVDLGKSSTEFGGQSGTYKITLVVGDAKLLKNPISWYLLSVAALPAAPEKKSEKVVFESLPEISHTFRQPEKRPYALVSDVFTVICLSPVLVLLVLWFKIGVNISNMPLSIWTLLFHGGFAAIFALYGLFWLRLDMFETLKYLGILGTFTFFTGHRLLRLIASRRK